MEKISQNLKKNLCWIYPLILLLYPLRHIRVGVEWWDTGYNYGNFTYMDRMDPMWLLSTYLGNALGRLFTLLPGGSTMLGLNVYTGLVVSLLALGGYFFFIRKAGLPRTVVFWGELLAVSFCWCPTALLYNYLTYLLMGAGVVLLYQALSGDSAKPCRYFVAAGVCLGLNVLVRFPNLAEMGLILAVWAMALIRRQKPGRTMLQTLQCLAGYLLGEGALPGSCCVMAPAPIYRELAGCCPCPRRHRNTRFTPWSCSSSAIICRTVSGWGIWLFLWRRGLWCTRCCPGS